MPQASLQSKLTDGEVVLGTFQIIDSPLVAEIMAQSGADYVLIDQEHGPLSAQETSRMCMATEQAGADPVVRVRNNSEAEIQRALDIGAIGVEVPQIESATDAKRAVNAARFDPQGQRGLNPFVRAAEYGAIEDYTDHANEEVVVIVHVEGTDAIENLDGILAVDGLDVIFLGPYDLSQSLGVPGQVMHDRVIAEMESVCERALEAGKVVGAYANDPEMANRWIDVGVQYIALYVDAPLLREAFEGLYAGVR